MREIEPERTFRIQVIISDEELAAVDKFRFERRMPSRAAAMRELIGRGLTFEPHPKPKSSQPS